MNEQAMADRKSTAANASSRQSGVIPWWVAAVAIVGSLLTAMGAVIALVRPSMLVSPHDQINDAVRIYAGYLASRNAVLALMLLALLAMRARTALGNLMVLVGLIQVFDIGMDLAEGRWTIVPGILVLGVLFLLGAARLSGGPFWRLESWTR